MSTLNRRHDIDWLRVIAIGLLLVYHTAITMQPWGIMIGFITNNEPWTSLWIPMAMLNVWRIPLLFFISGMGVYFAIQNRGWKQLLQDRSLRILVPYLFATFAIVPLHLFIWQNYYHYPLHYYAAPAHVWFLGNIFVYVLLFLYFFIYLKNNPERVLAAWIKKLFSTPLSLLLVMAVFMLETILMKPAVYEVYAMTWHGFFLGMIAFFFGFCFAFSGPAFWDMLIKWRWLLLLIALSMYVNRVLQPMMKVQDLLITIESCCWIFAIFAFGYKYLNFSNRALRYLSQAAYPVYIVHMVFLFVGSWWIFPVKMDVQFKFLMVLIFTIVSCLAFYELVIKRVILLRPLFGLKVLVSRRTQR